MPVNESNTIQYTVTTTRVPDGTTLYWKTTGNVISSDIVGGNTGSITVTNNRALLNVKIAADGTADGTKSLGITILTGSVNGTPVVNTSQPIILNDTSTVPEPIAIEYLVVAGGGGGAGSNYLQGGGGGGGGFKSGSILANTGTVFTVTVGSGGSAGPGYPSNGYPGGQGTPSSLTATGFNMTTPGGGGGTGSAGGMFAGPTGGSGGGGGNRGAGSNVGGSLATGSPGLGVAGTYGYPGNPANGPGLGGAGGAGSAGTPTTAGSGAPWSYTGNSYSGAGGAQGILGAGGVSGAGGVGGGGAAGTPSISAGFGNPGSPLTGGGGGSGAGPSPNGIADGGTGGSGVVILAVPTADYPGGYGPIASNPPAAPGMTVLTYTTSGTYTV
jgi:hypothetical protein